MSVTVVGSAVHPDSLPRCKTNTKYCKLLKIPKIFEPSPEDVFYSCIKYGRPDSTDLDQVCQMAPQTLFSDQQQELISSPSINVWERIRQEAMSDAQAEPILGNFYFSSVLSHNSLENALSSHLANKLCNNPNLPSNTLYQVFLTVLNEDPEIMRKVRKDLIATKERDPACISFVHCFLHFKGFLACQAQRVAHRLWINERRPLALLIQNRVAEVFGVDIHPGARIGSGVLFDHATGIVVGETAVIEDDVSILHNVTLGGTGKMSGDRHPKIGRGVFIGAGSCVLGNLKIGNGAKIGAGSIVLKDVPENMSAVGNPARLIEKKVELRVPNGFHSLSGDYTTWSDYVI